MNNDFASKKQLLAAWFQEHNTFTLAFSGGVDSALTAALAQRYQCRFQAVTAASPLLARCELDNARRVAQELALDWHILELPLLELPQVAHNHPERCYHCKRYIYQQLLAHDPGQLLVDGNNADDLLAHRPGNRAAAELAVAHPLAEAGLSKSEVRQYARELGLSVWDRPAAPCLASRFPYHSELTAERLQQAEVGEQRLRQLGFAQLRLRIYDGLCRLELPEAQLAQAVEQRREIINALSGLGFSHITLDLHGLRSGSMDINTTANSLFNIHKESQL